MFDKFEMAALRKDKELTKKDSTLSRCTGSWILQDAAAGNTGEIATKNENRTRGHERREVC